MTDELSEGRVHHSLDPSSAGGMFTRAEFMPQAEPDLIYTALITGDENLIVDICYEVRCQSNGNPDTLDLRTLADTVS